jgi:murein DD-endopeptidase MepM/ murein hydrolase activator NlpD
VAAAIGCLCGPSAITLGLLGRRAFARPPAASAPVAATEPQYLPWAGGRIVYVVQGNGSLPTHASVASHYGWDFALAYGEPALLGIPGVVVTARAGCDPLKSEACNDGYGNTVVVRVGDGSCARFEHLQTVTVAEGQPLGLGAQVGTVGSSGHSTGPHLHYQREDCATGRSLRSTFYEAGIPLRGVYVTSRLYPG